MENTFLIITSIADQEHPVLKQLLDIYEDIVFD